MPINFDHTESGNITLMADATQGYGCLVFPEGLNTPLEIMADKYVNCSYISGLPQLGVNNVFNYTNDIDTNCSYAYSVDSSSISNVYGSIFFGKDGKSKNNYCDGANYEVMIDNHIVHGACHIYNIGDSQSTVLLSRACTITDELSCLLFATTDAEIILYSNIDVIGKGYNSNDCFVAFNIKGAFLKGSTSAICSGAFIYTDIASCNLNQNFTKNVSIGNGNFCITVQNASGLTWISRACFLEIPAVTGQGSPVTHGIYWTCDSDRYWFNLYNWFSDQYQTTASSYPTSSTNVIMSGACAAYVDIDCNLWVQPNSIDTTRITDVSGVCLYSNAGNSFSGTIYGNATLYGNAVFGQPLYGVYWTNEANTNWFDLANWFLTSSFEDNASQLPVSTSNVLMYGNSGACIDLGCNLWIQPNSIDTRNSTSVEGICIYSQAVRSFSGIIYGDATLYGNARFN